MNVPLDELPQALERFGMNAYIVTVGAEGRPRATSVTVKWHRELLMIGAGTRTTENVNANEQVALLWPATVPGEHALIVDGWAAVYDSPETNQVIFVQPGKAVLHVSKGP
ncbi:MAG TPA: pyridoxamine 5'-phosphate oxidase family protein [Solirubrobacteraceae bacterium]|nr:pyridoxamine 5'-phosphate oxidase family protein [Solirubrobacteraceae bacterium]